MGKHLNTEKWIEIFIFFKEYLDYKITKMEFKNEYFRKGDKSPNILGMANALTFICPIGKK
ncbi:hypothetical protein [Mycoplasmopsis fermentans]|uniref:hypothetical protein n=1 Tax=Mycoplasmopsis fermentans TaxID=2115 RepID=UPI000F01D39A|nr:hypothetical protein [Mycoplasmopsis fermentans]RMX34569.1 hypothetical protein MFI1_0849 [Mycoplasmopsis fermentans MF-I1]RMX34579.1 hypothetical protein MFI2_0824 [Mycoplasmopsis fermentans MF-I2]